MDMDALLKKRENERAEVMLRTDEVVYSGQLEQGVELDYVLPEYYPEIFRIVKCTFSPKIVSVNLSAEGKLSIDGVVGIKVLYLAEGSNSLHCVDQRYTYTKVADIGRRNMSASELPRVSVLPKTDYCNCRAVSPRRIDVRGAVSCKVKAIGAVEYPLPKIPEKLQLKKEQLSCCGKTLYAEKLITLREDIETGASGIGFIIESRCVPKITDTRVIADKAVIKGTAVISALYALSDNENSDATRTEVMSADIPISAILDIPGITDSHLSSPDISVMSCELNSGTENGIISCELLIKCSISAQKEEEVEIVTDLYSTEYETEFSCAPLRLCTEPRTAEKQFSVKQTLSCESGEVRSVADCGAELFNLSCRPSGENEMTLSGVILAYAEGSTVDGTPFFIDKQEAFEQAIPAEKVNDDTIAEFSARVTDTGFSIRSDGTIDITAQAVFNGLLRNVRTINAVNAVTVYEDKPKTNDSDFALRIFYTGEGEDCWSIAKRCNTTVAAVMAENDIEDENTPLSGMVLIPTI